MSDTNFKTNRKHGRPCTGRVGGVGPPQVLVCGLTVSQMTRSSEKSAYQGKPHIGSGGTWDAGCGFAVPLRLLFQTPKSAHIPVRRFPENPVTQNLEVVAGALKYARQHKIMFCDPPFRIPLLGGTVKRIKT